MSALTLWLEPASLPNAGRECNNMLHETGWVRYLGIIFGVQGWKNSIFCRMHIMRRPTESVREAIYNHSWIMPEKPCSGIHIGHAVNFLGYTFWLVVRMLTPSICLYMLVCMFIQHTRLYSIYAHMLHIVCHAALQLRSMQINIHIDLSRKKMMLQHLLIIYREPSTNGQSYGVFTCSSHANAQD